MAGRRGTRTHRLTGSSDSEASMGPSLGSPSVFWAFPSRSDRLSRSGSWGWASCRALTAEFLVAWVILGFVALLLHEARPRGRLPPLRRRFVDQLLAFRRFTIPNDQEAALATVGSADARGRRLGPAGRYRHRGHDAGPMAGPRLRGQVGSRAGLSLDLREPRLGDLQSLADW